LCLFYSTYLKIRAFPTDSVVRNYNPRKHTKEFIRKRYFRVKQIFFKEVHKEKNGWLMEGEVWLKWRISLQPRGGNWRSYVPRGNMSFRNPKGDMKVIQEEFHLKVSGMNVSAEAIEAFTEDFASIKLSLEGEKQF
jgi:hypothetical protein